ncbi:unnamed protein product, partial [Urochloa humidicola]
MPPVLTIWKSRRVCAKYLYHLVHDENCFHNFLSFEIIIVSVIVLIG